MIIHSSPTPSVGSTYDSTGNAGQPGFSKHVISVRNDSIVIDIPSAEQTRNTRIVYISTEKYNALAALEREKMNVGPHYTIHEIEGVLCEEEKTESDRINIIPITTSKANEIIENMDLQSDNRKSINFITDNEPRGVIKKTGRLVSSGAKTFGTMLACAVAGEGIAGPLYDRHINGQQENAVDWGKTGFLVVTGIAAYGLGVIGEKCVFSGIHKEVTMEEYNEFPYEYPEIGSVKDKLKLLADMPNE